MTPFKLISFGTFCLVVAPAVLAAPGQTNPAACLVTVADHATISGSDAAAGADIYSGELLQTGDNGRLMVQCKTIRLAMASNSSIRVFQAGTETSVELERGIVDYSTSGHSEDLVLYSLDVKIVPDTKQATVGQVDVASHCELSVQSTKGTAAVTYEKETKVVEESKAYDVVPKMGVDYSDDWRPVPADYPDFPRQAKYHDSHHHIACAAAPVQNAATKAALDPGVFREIAVAGTLAGVGIVLWKIESESQYKPQ
jgi:hypothetical protein